MLKETNVVERVQRVQRKIREPDVIVEQVKVKLCSFSIMASTS